MYTNQTPTAEQASPVAENQPVLADELLATLTHAPFGRASLTYIGRRLSYLFPKEDISRALRERLSDGTFGFEYVGGFHAPQGLVFFAVSETEPTAPSPAANDVLDALLALLRHRTDNRGDSWRQATWDELQKTLGKSYGADAMVDGLRLGIQDGLLTCSPRVEEKPQPYEYICFYLAEHLTHTVIAYDSDAHQGLGFHVLAGTPEAATRKVQQSVYGGDDLAILGICPGTLPFRAVPGGSLPFEAL